MDRNKTLDLTCFNRLTFNGVIRLRTIADWAYDYYKKGFKLARIKLNDYEYHELMEEIREDNIYLIDKLHNGTLSLDLGLGNIEIVNVISHLESEEG